MIQFFNKKMSKKRKGFTLIELVVVIAILGLLIALAIPRLSGTRERAQENTEYANARTIASAIMMYEAEEGTIPVGTDQTPVALNLEEYLAQADQFSEYLVTIDADGVYTIGTPSGYVWTPGMNN